MREFRELRDTFTVGEEEMARIRDSHRKKRVPAPEPLSEIDTKLRKLEVKTLLLENDIKRFTQARLEPKQASANIIVYRGSMLIV
jgi:hypothetical protein